jgi:hypothetical protein
MVVKSLDIKTLSTQRLDISITPIATLKVLLIIYLGMLLHGSANVQSHLTEEVQLPLRLGRPQMIPLGL